MEKQFRVIVGEGHALTVKREMLSGGAWEISAVRSDGVKVEIDKTIHPLINEAVDKMIEVAGDFIKSESR